jgi:predicted dehydrogenase
MKKLRIGIIGAGAIVRQRHLPALQAMTDVEIVAICNSTFESGTRFCEAHAPHATPFKNWADVLALPDLDVVWIGAPPCLHAPVTLSALEAGKHVFCQARMAMNLEEAGEMLVAARQRPHLVTMLCPPPHGMRGDRVMRKLLSEQAIGRLHHLRLCSFGSQFLDPAAPAHWRQRIETSGLNVMTLGIYAEVLQRWFGPITSIFAQARTVTPWRDGYQVRIPDIVSVLCRFADDLEGVLEFSGVAHCPPPDELEIYGEDGKLVYDFNADAIELGRSANGGMEPVAIPPPQARFWTVEQDFIAAVRAPDAPRPHPTFEDGVGYMKVVQAVAESVHSRRAIDIL